MDIVMPGEMDGIDAGILIKQQFDIPVIFITAYADKKYITKARQVEPFGYILKPFHESEIQACIEIALYKKEIERNLRESEDKYRSMADTVNEVVIVVDIMGKILFWNKEAERILGYMSKEVTGKDFRFILPAERCKEFRVDTKSRSLEKLKKYTDKTFEHSVVKKNGVVFPAEFLLTPWSGESGINVTIIIRDITARREKRKQTKKYMLTLEAEMKKLMNIKNELITEAVSERKKAAESEVLVRETHHRVKNNLTLITSLINLQIEEGKNDKFHHLCKDLRTRINTMRIIHKKLYQSDGGSSIDLYDFIADLISSLKGIYVTEPGKIKINHKIERIPVRIDTAVPCGLIINELLSNSFKHAFPGDRAGEISIQASLPAQNKLELVIADNGVGLPENIDVGKPETFGLRLAKMLTEYQLQGKITLDRTKGTRFSINLNTN